MPKRNVSLLPIGVPKSKALKILEMSSKIHYKIGRLEEKFRLSILSEMLIQSITLMESVESTRIEGTQVTFTDMLEEKNELHPRWEINEVINYQKALQAGYEMIINGYPISSRLIKQLHSTLMAGGRGSTQAAGEFRKVQNFIGPTNRIEDATFIPVPANEIEGYMTNLELFINKHPFGEQLPVDHVNEEFHIFDENSDSLIKTAIIHAQFESIHPFLDGNG